MGSLLPDSSSSSGFRFPLRLTLRDRRTEKTAAASVEEMIEPSRNPSRGESPPTTVMNQPARAAVTKTPSVARIPPWIRTGRTWVQLVDNPPAKRM